MFNDNITTIDELSNEQALEILKKIIDKIEDIEIIENLIEYLQTKIKEM